MSDLRLTLACQRTDRTAAILDREIRVPGVELAGIDLFPATIFERAFAKREFDVMEMGLTFYLGTLGRAAPSPFVALPVFLSRVFRHSAIFVRAASSIAEPGDLAGKRWGELFFYGHDAGVWSKGVLADEYGVKPMSHGAYFTGGVGRPAPRWDWLPMAAPAGITHIGPDLTLDRMLEAGEIDVLFSAILPPGLRSGTVKRLFADAELRERQWYRRTRIFPIMHVVVLRRALYERHPWLARALFDAFEAARQAVYARYRSAHGNYHRLFMIPWLTELCEENDALMGDEPWTYGLQGNREALDTFLRYHFDQGLSSRRFTPEELFAPETHE